MSADQNDDTLKNEKLRGCKRIAGYIGEKERIVFYGLERGYIPATKEGRIWVTTKTRLRNHYNGEAS